MLIKNPAPTPEARRACTQRAGRHNPASAKAAYDALLAYAEAGHLRPHISHRLPLARYAEAMRLLMERKAIGRVVLISDG